MKTIVNTNGKIILLGDEDGLIITNKDGVEMLDVSEVSDSQVINLFCKVLHGGVLNTKGNDGFDFDFEILTHKG